MADCDPVLRARHGFSYYFRFVSCIVFPDTPLESELLRSINGMSEDLELRVGT